MIGQEAVLLMVRRLREAACMQSHIDGSSEGLTECADPLLARWMYFQG